MRGKELLALGLVTAAAGCGGNSHSAPRAYQSRPDITHSGCDLEQSKLAIYRSLREHQPLEAYSLADPANKVDVVTGLNGRGPEIINPLILGCDGAIKYVIGIDRGFAGTDMAVPVIASAKGVSFSTINPKEDWQPHTIYFKNLSNFLLKVTVRDPDLAPHGGARGLITTSGRSFAVMP